MQALARTREKPLAQEQGETGGKTGKNRGEKQWKQAKNSGRVPTCGCNAERRATARRARVGPSDLRVAAGLGLGRPPLKSLDFLALFCSAAPHHDPDLAGRPAADHRGEDAVDVDWHFRVGFVRAVWLRSGSLASFGRFWLRSGTLDRSSSHSPSCRGETARVVLVPVSTDILAAIVAVGKNIWRTSMPITTQSPIIAPADFWRMSSPANRPSHRLDARYGARVTASRRRRWRRPCRRS